MSTLAVSTESVQVYNLCNKFMWQSTNTGPLGIDILVYLSECECVPCVYEDEGCPENY